MPKLVIEKGPDKGRVIHITAGSSTVVGRDTTATVPLRDTMASRHHFRIESREDGFYVVDLDSLNGTLLNGDPVHESKLQYGDLVKVGETLFSFLADEQAAATLLGQKIGGYRIIERIGRGGMGTVYKAEQVDLQRIVALKVISEENTKDKSFIELFLHEARAAAKLNHTNIVQVYDVKRHEQIYFFSMEYVPGGSVQDLVNRTKVLSVDTALSLILDATRGLDYAHRKELIHRDIKPDNLMISEDGSVKIGDLGLARSPKEKVGPNEQGMVIGTPHYIAPEQVLGRPADYRSDLYSLGSTFYRMVTGITPYQAPSVRELVNKKVREDPRHPCELNPDLPRPVAEVLLRMMAREPEKRFASAAELIPALEALGQGRAPSSLRPTTGRRVRTNRVSRWRMMASAAAGLLLLAAAAFGLSAYLGRTEEKGGEVATAVTSPELLERMYLAAHAFEEKMDRADPAQVREAIALYQRVIEQEPESRPAGWSKEQVGKLQRTLREAEGAIELAALETRDTERWLVLSQTIREGRFDDLTPWEASLREYEALAERFGDVPAGESARRAGAHLKKWREGLDRERSACEEALRKAGQAAEASRFQEAWSILQEYLAGAQGRCEVESFTRDRYASLLFDQITVQRQADLRTLSNADFIRRRDEARTFRNSQQFEKAREILAPVLQFSLPADVEQARAVIAEIDAAAAKLAKETEDREREAKRKDLEEDRSRFERDALAAYLNFSVKLDLEGALKSWKSMAPFKTAEYEPRRLARVTELERAAFFKRQLIKNINDVGATNLDRRFRMLKNAGTGTLQSANDREISMTLGSGTMSFLFTQFAPSSPHLPCGIPTPFYDWVSAAWRLRDNQTAERCGLAMVAIEFGLYEEALAQLNLLAKSPDYTAQPSLREFCDRYRALLGRGETNDALEVEAIKRLARADRAMSSERLATADGPEAAAREISLLRSTFANTEVVRQRGDLIEQWLQTLSRRREDSDRKRRNREKMQGLQKDVDQKKQEFEKRRANAKTRLSRIAEETERRVHEADLLFAAGSVADSNRLLTEARLGAERDRRRNPGLMSPILVGLYRNALFLGNANQSQELRNLLNRPREIPPDLRDKLHDLEEWARQLQTRADLTALRDALETDPENPEAIWNLARAMDREMQDLPAVVAYYELLLERHGEFVARKGGEVEIRLIEVLYLFRDMPRAIELAMKLAEARADHPVLHQEGRWGLRHRLSDAERALSGKPAK